jgi:hypothetical protein
LLIVTVTFRSLRLEIDSAKAHQSLSLSPFSSRFSLPLAVLSRPPMLPTPPLHGQQRWQPQRATATGPGVAAGQGAVMLRCQAPSGLAVTMPAPYRPCCPDTGPLPALRPRLRVPGGTDIVACAKRCSCCTQGKAGPAES